MTPGELLFVKYCEAAHRPPTAAEWVGCNKEWHEKAALEIADAVKAAERSKFVAGHARELARTEWALNNLAVANAFELIAVLADVLQGKP